MKKFLFVFLLTNLNAFSFISIENTKDSLSLEKREKKHFVKMNEVKDLGMGIFNEEITQEDAFGDFQENLIFLEKKGSLTTKGHKVRRDSSPVRPPLTPPLPPPSPAPTPSPPRSPSR